MKKGFDNEPVHNQKLSKTKQFYDEKIKTNFHNKGVLKGFHCLFVDNVIRICFSDR